MYKHKHIYIYIYIYVNIYIYRYINIYIDMYLNIIYLRLSLIYLHLTHISPSLSLSHSYISLSLFHALVDSRIVWPGKGTGDTGRRSYAHCLLRCRVHQSHARSPGAPDLANSAASGAARDEARRCGGLCLLEDLRVPQALRGILVRG